MSSCNPLMESLRCVTVCNLALFVLSWDWTLQSMHQTASPSQIMIQHYFPVFYWESHCCVKLNSSLVQSFYHYKKNEVSSISDSENHLIILLEIFHCTNLCVKMSRNIIIQVRNQWYCRIWAGIFLIKFKPRIKIQYGMQSHHVIVLLCFLCDTFNQ